MGKKMGYQNQGEKTAGFVNMNPNAPEESLIRRIHIFLEDREWDKALAYCDNLLDLNPERSELYCLKLCASYKAVSLGDVLVINPTLDILKENNYRRAKLYANLYP